MTSQKVKEFVMVRSLSAPSSKRGAKGERPEQGSVKDIREFLVRELPPEKTRHAAYLANAILRAAARYDRYAACRNEWLKYTARRSRLERIGMIAADLVSGICKLDILSRDDLANRVDSEQIEALVGSLRLLSEQTDVLAKEIQKNGKPRDLAEERWILEIVDNENASGEPIRVWKSVTVRVSNFYRLLELSLPESFPRYGKLSRRQVDRALKHRRTRRRKPANLSEALEILAND
jgi:hypothetical protein